MHLEEFKKNEDLINEFGEGNAHLAWVMALYLDRNDIATLASESLTDGNDDKKIDFINISDDRIVISQGYYSTNGKESAPSNKASDLNTAFAWLSSGNIEHVPNQLRGPIIDCRKALEDSLITSIEFLYVHNVSESESVKKELDTLVEHAKMVYKDKEIDISAHELGIEKVERLFTTKNSQIAIKDEILIECGSKIEEQGEGWKAVQFSATGEWLKTLYNTYGDLLYSANYRGFLGLKRKKINGKIKGTAESKPKNFWAFNNGITMLTTEIKECKDNKIVIEGVSIINGAQTSGSLFSIDLAKTHVLKEVKVMCRIIECKDPKLVAETIRFNNTQNAITSWDMYSNSADQLRIKDEFKKLGKEYSLKKGFEGSDTELGIASVAQPSLALRGDYRDANRGKNYIFDNNYTYNYVFERKSAKHLLFSYSLSKSIEKKKSFLKTKNNNEGLTSGEKKQYDFFKSLSFKHFFIAIVGYCLEQITSREVDLDFICFKKGISEKTISELVEIWMPIVNVSLTAFSTTLSDMELIDVISTKEKFLEIAQNVSALISMSKSMNSTNFDSFAQLVITKQTCN